MTFRTHIFDLAREATGAGLGVAGTGAVAGAVLGTSWLVPVLQVAVSIIFIVKAIDKRLERMHHTINETRGDVEILRRRVEHLEDQK